MEAIRKLLRRPIFWATGYAVWAGVLYFVSSIEGIPGPAIPHLDKLEHAGYFAAGHLVLGLALTIKNDRSSRTQWLRIGMLLVFVAGIVGVLDEYHQSFTPGRNGNDLGDMIADMVGGTIAAFALPKAHSLVRRFTA